MALLSRVKVLAVLTILILTLSILAVTRTPARAASLNPSCTQSFVPSPNAGSGANALFGVSAIASNDVWAVGEFSSVSAGQTLVEHWNGVSWSVVASPSPALDFNSL